MMRTVLTRWDRRLVALFVALTLTTACASLAYKDKASRATQSVYATLQTLDKLEIEICKPGAPPKDNTCTATPRLLSDADHQRISRWLAQAFGAVDQAARTLAAWDPSTPKPTNLPSARIYVEQIQSLVATLPVSPEIQRMLAILADVFKAIDSVGSL